MLTSPPIYILIFIPLIIKFSFFIKKVNLQVIPRFKNFRIHAELFELWEAQKVSNGNQFYGKLSPRMT